MCSNAYIFAAQLRTPRAQERSCEAEVALFVDFLLRACGHDGALRSQATGGSTTSAVVDRVDLVSLLDLESFDTAEN